LGEEELAQGAIAGCLNIFFFNKIFVHNIRLEYSYGCLNIFFVKIFFHKIFVHLKIHPAASCVNIPNILNILNILEDLTEGVIASFLNTKYSFT